jgi:hypothetical protein
MFKFIFLFLVSFNCFAFDEWSDADVKREAVYQILHVIDWGQTRTIAKNPDKYYEYNSMIGKHPSVGRVDGYMATSALLHIGITHILPVEYRTTFQYFTIGFKSGLVVHNFEAGINVSF